MHLQIRMDAGDNVRWGRGVARRLVRGAELALCVGSLSLAVGCSGKGAVASRPESAIAIEGPAEQALRQRAIAALEEASQVQDPRVRANAMEAAGLESARRAETLRRGLRDESVAVRSVAAMTVGEHRIRELAEDVRPLLQDNSPYLKCAAIYALVQCGDLAVDRRPLAKALLDDPSTRVRSHAAYILGELGDATAMPLLRQSLRSKPARASQTEVNLFQLQVAEALVKLGDDEQLEAIRAALYPSRPEELETAALAVQILGSIEDRRSIDHLIYLSATKDQDGKKMPAEVRLAIASSLAKMGLKQGDFIADEFVKDPNAALRSQVAFVYGETGTPGNLGVLDTMLADPDWGVRVAAAAAVLKIADADAKLEPTLPGRTASGASGR